MAAANKKKTAPKKKSNAPKVEKKSNAPKVELDTATVCQHLAEMAASKPAALLSVQQLGIDAIVWATVRLNPNKSAREYVELLDGQEWNGMSVADKAPSSLYRLRKRGALEWSAQTRESGHAFHTYFVAE